MFIHECYKLILGIKLIIPVKLKYCTYISTEKFYSWPTNLFFMCWYQTALWEMYAIYIACVKQHFQRNSMHFVYSLVHRKVLSILRKTLVYNHCQAAFCGDYCAPVLIHLDFSEFLSAFVLLLCLLPLLIWLTTCSWSLLPGNILDLRLLPTVCITWLNSSYTLITTFQLKTIWAKIGICVPLKWLNTLETLKYKNL